MNNSLGFIPDVRAGHMNAEESFGDMLDFGGMWINVVMNADKALDQMVDKNIIRDGLQRNGNLS